MHNWVGFLVWVAVSTHSLVAQDLQERVPPDSLSSQEVVTEEVVVTGTLREVSRMQSAVPTELYAAAFFRRTASTTLYDGLSQVSGVQPMLACGVCYTGNIRINGLEGPYTLVLVDGMPIVSGLATVYGFTGIPTSLIQQVEVVRGPAGVLYGSEALAGVINVRTLQPWQLPRFTADFQLTSYNEANLDLTQRITLGKATGLVAFNTYKHHTRWDKNTDNFTDIPLIERYGLFTKWSWEKPASKRASIALRYLYEDRFGGELQWQPENRGGDDVYGESIFTHRVELMGVYDLPGKEDFSVAYSLNYHDQNSVYGNTPYTASQGIAFAQLTWSNTLGNHRLLAGSTFRYNAYDDNTPATLSSDGRVNQPSRFTLPGVFLQDEWQVAEKHTLLLGGRWDQSAAHGAIFSGRVNYKLDLAPLTSLRLSAGNGFRVVNLFTEDHAALTGARAVVLEDELQPERSWNANLNLLSYISLGTQAVLTLDGSLFYTRFSNQILPDFESNPNEIRYGNLEGFADSKGVNLQLAFKTSGPWDANLGATWLDVRTVENGVVHRQPLTPRFQATYQLRYQWHKAKLTVDATGELYAPMKLVVVPNDVRPSLSPWFLLQNLQVSRQMGAWEVYVIGKNLLDFMPRDPLLRPFDPFDRTAADPVANPNGYTFDTAYGFSPLQGRRVALGVRYVLK